MPAHRFQHRASSMSAGALDRYNSQFRLRQLVVDLAVRQQPEVAVLLRPDMRPCSIWKFERVSGAGASWRLHVRGCRWGGRGEAWATPVPESEAESFMLQPHTVVVPRSRMHPGFIDDTLAAGSFSAIAKYVSLRDALRRGAYANVSARTLYANVSETIGRKRRPDIFPEALLHYHLKQVGVEVLQTRFNKGDAGFWTMGRCPNDLSRAKAAGMRRRGERPRRACAVSLLEQHSVAKCVAGSTFGCKQGRIWVKQCRGVFRCAVGSSAVRCGYPPGQPRYTCSCDGRDDDASLREPTQLTPTPARRPRRVAVCMAGAARTFTRPHVWRSIGRMLDSLANGTEGGRVDLFASLVLRDAEPKQQREWAATPVDCGEPALRAALHELRPRAVSILNASSSQSITLNPRCSLDGFLAASKGNARRAFGQWLTAGRCVPLIEAAEAQDGIAYTHVVRTRPDLYWAAAHPPLEALSPAVSYWDRRPLTPFAEGYHGDHPPPQADWHFIAPRAAALAALQLYDRYLACDRAAPPFVATERALAHEHNSEAMLQASLSEYGPLHSVALPMLLVRDTVRDKGARNLLMCSEAYAKPVFGMRCDALYAAAYP